MRLALQQRAPRSQSPRRVVVRRSPRNPQRALVRFGSLMFQAALGRGGISVFKRESDGATPRATMAVLGGFRRGYRPGQRPAALPSPVALQRASQQDGWCDAPDHGAYNRPVRLPFPASCERLLRDDRLYDAVLVLDWNVSRRARGHGSAIFLHVAREGYRPTEGCVALDPRDLKVLLGFIRRGDIVQVL